MKVFVCVRGGRKKWEGMDMLMSNCCILVSAINGCTHCSRNCEKFNLRAII